MTHSSSSEKPDVMSFTWNPRLVKTPTPTMSATTIAVAVMQDILATAAPLETGLVIKELSFPHAAVLRGKAQPEVRPGAGQANALAISSVIFLASPSNIIVLSR